MKCTEETPKIIEVGFYYNKQKPFYKLYTPEITIEYISLNGILSILEELLPSELKDYSISYMVPSGIGIKQKWSCDGEYFMANFVLKCLD